MSHAHVDKEIAESIAHAIIEIARDVCEQECRGGDSTTRSCYEPDVFYSSDVRAGDGGLRAGDWFTQLQQRVESSNLTVSVHTPRSLASAWISFESGPAGLIANRTLFPFCLTLTNEQLPPPFRHLQCYTPDSLEKFLSEVFSALGMRLSTLIASRSDITISNLRTKLRQVEDKLNNSTLPPTSDGVWVYSRDQQKPTDKLLEFCESASFLALTYRTFGEVLSSGRAPVFRSMRRFELSVYSLPTLRARHPTLNRNHDALEAEWITGITNVIRGLLVGDRCPVLEHLDVRVISEDPQVTSTLLSIRNDLNGVDEHLRWTPIFRGFEPQNMPTIHTTNVLSGAQTHSVFRSALKERFYRKNTKYLYFPVKMKHGISSYQRTDIASFVKRLSTVANLEYEPKDKEFELRVGMDPNMQIQGGCESTITPQQIFFAFKQYRDTSQLDRFKWAIDFKKSILDIDLAGHRAGGSERQKGDVFHVAACFALLTCTKDHQRKIVLIEKQKPPTWPLDVPGGKVAVRDKSVTDTLTRELFEELGLEISAERFNPCSFGFKYDPQSAKEKGVPVFAVYYQVELTGSEQDYLALLNKEESSPCLGSIAFKSVDQLCQEKLEHRSANLAAGGGEAVCHAPLEAIQALPQPS